MDLNATPSAERIHIGIFGKRNAGKSSLINAITGQNLAIVSDTKGTTTDPVYKAMEILPLGPVAKRRPREGPPWPDGFHPPYVSGLLRSCIIRHPVKESNRKT